MSSSYTIIKDRPFCWTVVDQKGKVMEVLRGGATVQERGRASLLREKFYLDNSDVYRGEPIRTILNSIVHDKTPGSLQSLYTTDARGRADPNQILLNNFDINDIDNIKNMLDSRPDRFDPKKQVHPKYSNEWIKFKRAGLH